MSSPSTALADSPAFPAAAVEAARYALLRRLAPSMRHHLVVHLQPIGMIHEIMERRLKAPEPRVAEVLESAAKIRGFARAALDSTLDMVTWLAPDEAAVVSLEEGVRECMGLVATAFTFRGFSLRNEVAGMAQHVRRPALRSCLMAALFVLADDGEPPADIVITAQAVGKSVVLGLERIATTGERPVSAVSPYRLLALADLQAIAGDEGVAVQPGIEQLQLRFTVVAAPPP
ncbi:MULTISPECIES: hypothetical protein [Ramlibacter]|uniref:Histidine kinase n=1 Tax=Ramlibacter aquaticus TaxID=2780094 RepID=A0ABR9SHP1_9BURK|nr:MULTISPECIES: hypothetical protein [Ramlibacter]MBE7941838.1 hypothetical protein [Ramlibacter aquaticus]